MEKRADGDLRRRLDGVTPSCWLHTRSSRSSARWPKSRATPPVAAVPNPVMGSLEVEVEVDNTSGMLESGMSARVRIYGETLNLAGHAARGLRRLFKGKVWC